MPPLQHGGLALLGALAEGAVPLLLKALDVLIADVGLLAGEQRRPAARGCWKTLAR